LIHNKSYTEGLRVSIKLSMTVAAKINQEGASLVLLAQHFHHSMEQKTIITLGHIRNKIHLQFLQKITATIILQGIHKRTYQKE